MKKLMLFGIVILFCISIVNAETLTYDENYDLMITNDFPVNYTSIIGTIEVQEFVSATDKSVKFEIGGTSKMNLTRPYTMDTAIDCWNYSFALNHNVVDAELFRFLLPINMSPTYAIQFNEGNGVYTFTNSGGNTATSSYSAQHQQWHYTSIIACNTSINITTDGIQWTNCSANCGTNWNAQHSLDHGDHRTFWLWGENTDHYLDNFTIINMTTAPTPTNSITLIYPLANQRNNFDGWVNFTTGLNSNCTINNTDFVLNTSLSTPLNKFYFNSNYENMPEINHTLNISCWDYLNDNTTSSFTFGIDRTFPKIKTNLDGNNVVVYNNISFQMNFTDETLIHSFNVTSGNYNYSLNNINLSFYSFNGSINLENHSTGLHTINVGFCDAHTKKKIKDYNVYKDYTKKKITYNSGVSIMPKNPSHFDFFDTEKDYDRYGFVYSRSNSYKDKYETFIITSNKPIEIVGSNKYTGWIVTGNNWIDFENEGKHKANIKYISDYEIEITTKGETFNSIGDLNCNSTTLNFYKFNYTVEYDLNTVEGDTDTYKLILNVTDIPLTSDFANFYFDSTLYSTTLSSSTTQYNYTSTLIQPLLSNLSIIKDLYYRFGLNDFTFNTTVRQQTLIQLYITSCGTLTNTTSINFTGYSELSKNMITTDFLGYFQVYTDNPAIFRNYTFNFTDLNHHTICIYPPGTSMYSNYITEYSKTGYATRNYIRRNTTLNGSQRQIPLYLLNNGNATTITVHTLDSEDEPISNVLVEMWRFDLDLGNFSLVETRITNSEGEGAFSVVYNTDYYRFKLYRDTLLSKEDDDKFQITTLNLYYNLFGDSSDALANWIEYREIPTRWVYYNDTNKLSLEWSYLSANADYVALDIKHNNGSSFYTSTSTDVTSSMNYTFVGSFNNTYTATAYIVSKDGIAYPVIDAFSGDLRTNTLYALDPQGNLGIATAVYLGAGLLFFVNPIIGMVGTVLAVYLDYALGLIPGVLTEIVGLLAIALFTIVLMMRKYTQ